MKTIEEIHRENLQALAREAEGVAAVATKIGCSSSQYSQWMNGSENSGTGKPRGLRASSARRIEKACGKSSGWLDKDHSSIDAAEAIGGGSANQSADEADALVRLLTVYHLADLHGKGAIDDVVDLVEVHLNKARAKRQA